MKLHIALRPLPVLILSKGLETELDRKPTGYEFRVITVLKMPDSGFKSRIYVMGAIETETYRTEWLNGWVLFISPFAPIQRLIDTMK